MAATSGSGSVENWFSNRQVWSFVRLKPDCAMSLERGAFTNYNLLVNATDSEDGFLTRKSPHESYVNLCLVVHKV